MRRGGFLKLIILIVIALIVLGYFGFDMETILHKPPVERNLLFAKEKALIVWDRALKPPIMFAWNKIIKPSLERIPGR